MVLDNSHFDTTFQSTVDSAINFSRQQETVAQERGGADSAPTTNKMWNCIVSDMDFPATYYNVSYVTTQLARTDQTLCGFKGLLILLFQFPLRGGSS